MTSKATALSATRAEGKDYDVSNLELLGGPRCATRASEGLAWAVPVRNENSPYGAAVAIAYRCFEIIVALTGLVLGAPLVLVAAIFISCDTPGSPIYVHRRPGRSKVARGSDLRGRMDLRAPSGGFDDDALYYVPSYFNLVKLRSMYSDSRLRFPDLYAYRFTNESFRSAYPTLKDDPRVTRVGRIVRKLSIDEILNLWSVLKGDISLVGPRPEAPEVLQYYRQEEMYKFICKPGITGLAQVNGRGLLNWEDTIAWDLRYVRERSLALDLKILFLTIVSVVTRYGAF